MTVTSPPVAGIGYTQRTQVKFGLIDGSSSASPHVSPPSALSSTRRMPRFPAAAGPGDRGIFRVAIFRGGCRALARCGLAGEIAECEAELAGMLLEPTVDEFEAQRLETLVDGEQPEP